MNFKLAKYKLVGEDANKGKKLIINANKNMNNNTGENLLDEESPNIVYANFWSRVGASLLDSLILSPIILPLTYFDIVNWKSPEIYILISILGITYKPLLEYYYGATIGKKILTIKVVNLEHTKANLTEIMMRNMIIIIIGILSGLYTLSLFSIEGFDEISNYVEYAAFVTQNKNPNWISALLGLYHIIDVIFLWTDEKNRTLHDRIGKTYVIKLSPEKTITF